jgi:hypothetical protein
MAAPAGVGNVLVGGDARQPTPRTLLRFYGTRDVALGIGTLRGAAGGGDARPWVTAGIASDALDAVVMLTEWRAIEEDKRVPGVLMALGAAAAGIALLARS